MTGNPLEFPPLEIVDKGIEAVRAYFMQLDNEGQGELYEAKLIIVGEGGAGKTTLAHKLLDAEYQLHDEDSTRGIEILSWSFETPRGQSFRVNIWDFGGQEIYHATHQFFLTKRSLYALVADNRTENTDFWYWLQVVELVSDNSPLLIIKNEKKERHRDINEQELRGSFTNLKETLATNFATNRGLSELASAVQHHITLLPHIGNTLPRTWLRVREQLESDSRDYISLDEYQAICQANGFERTEDKLQLSGYLHDLGVCLHFQDDPLLRKTVILNPKWATDAVYMVLDNETVTANMGRFNEADLTAIWSGARYENTRSELLQLMKRFKLCYQITDSSSYIAPQLLTQTQPDYPWDDHDNLIVRYRYEFMPKGIVTQFIVSMHRYILEQKYVWRSGVMLEKDDTRAEVIEDYKKRQIRIRVTGRDKRDLMTIVTYEIDRIHASYPRIKCSKMIPCNCPECSCSRSPHSYKYETLKRFIDRGHPEIQCQNSCELVQVRGLIDDVEDSRLLRKEHAPSFSGHFGDVNVFMGESPEGRRQPMPRKPKAKTVEQAVHVKSAWANGSFYLFAVVIVLVALGFLVKAVPWYTLPIVLLAAPILVLLIGYLQLRQDNRLSEKSFVEVMKMVINQLPLLARLGLKLKEKSQEPPE